MKKIQFSISIIICLTILFAGCTKDLTVLPVGNPVSTTFWQTADDAIKGANAMYEPLGSDGIDINKREVFGRGYMWYMNCSDDMVTGKTNAAGDALKNFQSSSIKSNSYLSVQWKYRYIVIKRSNDVIVKVPNIVMNAALKNRILGEAYFLNAFMYFELAYNYANDKAGVPIIDPLSTNTDPTPRAKSITENFNLIESEFKMAASLLPFFDSYSAQDYGRAHKTAAWALLSKMYLYKKDYANAEKYADSVIMSGKHALLTNFADVFKVSNNWSREYIWSASGTAKNGGWGSILPAVMLENKGWNLYNGWGYFMPTKELYDAFETGDLRRGATILKPGDVFTYFGSSKTYSTTNSASGMQFRKYMDPFSFANPIGTYLSTNQADNPVTELNVPLIRYAEVILIKAEAKLMQGKNADVEINLIRNRAGLTSITNATMAELKKQRRCELAGEWADRHRDLVRWGDAQAAYSQPLHKWDGTICWPARVFNPSYMDVFPVPQVEIDNSGGIITQNQGW